MHDCKRFNFDVVMLKVRSGQSQIANNFFRSIAILPCDVI